MDLGDILSALERSPGDARWLRALGGALGVELTHRRLEQLVPVIRTLSKSGGDAFASGYAAALHDVALAFQAELGAELDDAEIARLVAQSPYSEALAALAAGNQTVTAIGIAMGKNKSSASRALSVLRDAGLVSAYAAPNGVGDERARPHSLTVRGRRLVDQMSKERARAARRRTTPVRGQRVAQVYAAPKKLR